jgi:hypothetical protein
MDMSLLRHGGLRIGGRAARLDYCVFVATLQALQLATATARAESRCGGEESLIPPAQCDPLAEIVLGSPHWQDAVVAQGGSFNPAFARGLDPE